jgi:excisionase family DNA binding protein
MNDPAVTPSVLAYRIADACRVLGIGRTSLYALIADGLIEARHCRGRTLVPAASLSAFLASLPPAPIRKRGVSAA